MRQVNNLFIYLFTRCLQYIHSLEVSAICGHNTCCTKKYTDQLTLSTRGVFKECINDTFSELKDLAEDFFDDFKGTYTYVLYGTVYSYT